MAANENKWVRNDWLSLLVLMVVSVLLYFPLFGNSFLADDYRVMNRVGLHGRLLVAGFFRPLSDITLYGNYLIGELNPFNYYVTNAVIHGGTAMLLLQFCRRTALIFVEERSKEIFAWTTALLFVTYPYHNESIAWLVGRASLLATFFGAASLLVSVSAFSLNLRIVLCTVFYFIGLMAYESIFPLPVIVLILSWKREHSTPVIFKWLLAFLFTLGIHFGARRIFSGVITESYGETVFSPDLTRHFINFFKVAGRLVLPPSNNAVLLQLLFFTILAACVGLWLFAMRKKIYRFSIFEAPH
ncbi:MAG: hypothetical protein EOO00_07915, partial [Chitinophagaceae bacterium]